MQEALPDGSLTDYVERLAGMNSLTPVGMPCRKTYRRRHHLNQGGAFFRWHHRIQKESHTVAKSQKQELSDRKVAEATAKLQDQAAKTINQVAAEAEAAAAAPPDKPAEKPGVQIIELTRKEKAESIVARLKELEANVKLSKTEQGNLLRAFTDDRLYEELGFKNMAEFNAKIFNRSKSWSSNLIALVRRQELLAEAKITEELSLADSAILAPLEEYPEEFVRAFVTSNEPNSGYTLKEAVEVQVRYVEYRVKNANKEMLPFDTWYEKERQMEIDEQIAAKQKEVKEQLQEAADEVKALEAEKEKAANQFRLRPSPLAEQLAAAAEQLKADAEAKANADPAADQCIDTLATILDQIVTMEPLATADRIAALAKLTQIEAAINALKAKFNG